MTGAFWHPSLPASFIWTFFFRSYNRFSLRLWVKSAFNSHFGIYQRRAPVLHSPSSPLLPTGVIRKYWLDPLFYCGVYVHRRRFPRLSSSVWSTLFVDSREWLQRLFAVGQSRGTLPHPLLCPAHPALPRLSRSTASPFFSSGPFEATYQLASSNAVLFSCLQDRAATCRFEPRFSIVSARWFLSLSVPDPTAEVSYLLPTHPPFGIRSLASRISG